MNYDEIVAVVRQCSFPDYTFVVTPDRDGAAIRAHYTEPDTDTGIVEVQRTRRWYISPHKSKSEIVGTVFKCVLTSMEHRAREWFKYRGEAVYGPHFDVDIIHALCRHGVAHAQRPRSTGGSHATEAQAQGLLSSSGDGVGS